MSWIIPDDLWIYDCEVFKYNWLFVFKNKLTGHRIKIHNDPEALQEFIDSKPLLCGYNNKFYDNYIIIGILIGLDTIELKELSDFIVNSDARAWEHPYLQNARIKLRSFDIYDDMQPTSLKAVEGHRGRNIKESSVDFNIDRSLTEDELKMTFNYCCEDVDATEDLFDLRFEYLSTKVELGEMKDISSDISLNCTNAKIVAKYMGAVRQEWKDGRDYEFPKELDQSIIPKELLDFFMLTNDKSISDAELFDKELIITIGNCLCKFKFGGAHGSYEHYHAKTDDEYVIRNKDVGSLYPSLILFFNYLSRNVQDPQVFIDTYTTRMNAKRGIGNKDNAKKLKLPLNTISGATDQIYSDLYDPKQARSMRYTGQLLIAELVIRLTNNVPSFELINLNTDGFAYKVRRSELELLEQYCIDWQNKTHLTLEEDFIDEIWIKDVNNLIIKMENGKIKTVGSYVNWGVSLKGQWAINNNYIIVKKAILEYLIKDIPVETTINNCTNILEFQLIAKVGSLFHRGFQIINGVEVPTQKVNRVYASKDITLGTLFKVGGKRNSVVKIQELPEHCVIDNDNQLTIDDIDKSWYIKLAKRKINDYLGISNKKPRTKINKEENNMANTKKVSENTIVTEVVTENYSTMNVFKKMQVVRKLLIEETIKKSGINSHLEYEYFELKDFLPIVTPIFYEVGLTPITTFNKEEATLTIYNADKSDESIVFTTPMPPMSSIISNTGKKVVNEAQTLGLTMTYLRRYLYINALDLIESDGIEDLANKNARKLKDKAVDDSTTNNEVVTNVTEVKPVVKGVPLNNMERKDIVKQIVDESKDVTTNSNVNLNDLISELKALLKKLIATNKPELKSYVQGVILSTERFQKITIEEANKFIVEAKKKVEAIK